MIKFVVVHHEPTVSVIEQYIADYKPHAVISIGDIFDFRNLRRGADDAERSESMREDVEAGKDLINRFKFTHVCLGNHDQRLWDEAEQGKGLVKEYCQRGVEDIEYQFRKHKTSWVPYSIHKGIQLGPAYFVHGFRCNIHAAKSTAEDHAKPNRTIFFGHTHSVSHYKAVNGTQCYNVGCACDLDMEYARRRPNTLRWEHSFAAGEIHPTHVETWQFRPNNGKWRMQTEVKEYVGR
jgi:predicted phosphodiesterase